MTDVVHAMVFNAPGQPLESRTFSRPSLKSGEVLARIRLCTICGSDLHTHDGRRMSPTPTILGHEIIGEIAQLPPNEPPVDVLGQPLALGQRVTWTIAASCGTCHNCRRGIPQKCDRLFKYGHEQIADDHPLSGGLAEFCHLAAGTGIVPLPDELPDRVACPANCATATVAAAFRVAGDCRNAVVVIQGLGLLGLTACAFAKSLGASEIIAVDPRRDRCDQAHRFGASYAANDLQDVVEHLTVRKSSRRVDVGFDFCGNPSAIEQAIPLLDVAGRYVLVGSVFPTRPLQLSAESLVRRLIRIEGVHNYAPADLSTAVEFLTESHTRFPFADLVADPLPLAEADAAFDLAHTGPACRFAVSPSVLD